MAARRLANNLLSRDTSTDALATLANHLEMCNSQIEQQPLIGGRKDWINQQHYHDLDGLSCENSPLIGKSSWVGPVLKIWIEDGEGRAEVNFDWRFEGPLYCVHGGYIAAIFDEFLGWAQMLSGGSGATKHLAVTYHKPTPLHTDLLLKARLTAVENRKIRVSGEMYAGKVLTASAEGLFISFGDKGTSELHQRLET